MIKNTFEHLNRTTQKTLTINSNRSQYSLPTTNFLLTLNTDLTPIEIKIYLIKTNQNIKITTMNSTNQ